MRALQAAYQRNCQKRSDYFPSSFPKVAAPKSISLLSPKLFPFTAELYWATCSVLSLLEAEQVLRGRAGGTESC